MRELRRLEPQRLVEKQLPRRVRNVILAPDHMRNLHQRIVDNDGKVIRRVPVGAYKHGITDDFAAERDVAANDIVECDVDAGRHLEANDRMLPTVNPRAHFFRW
jgi:hypothetical protein